jgi:hypothetical protein
MREHFTLLPVDSLFKKLKAIPILLMNATTNQANPMQASNVNHPTDGILKNLDMLFSAQSKDT